MPRSNLIAAACAVAGLTAALVLAAPAPSARSRRRRWARKCGVFPRPGADVAADAPSLADQRAWNQDISRRAGRPALRRDHRLHQRHGGDELHPDFGSPREYGIPYSVVGKQREADQGQVHRLRRRVRPRQVPDPARRAGRGRAANADGDRHVLAYDKARCKLYELYRAFPKRKRKRWEADVGVIWDLRSAGLRTEGCTSADAAGLPIFPGLVRYDEVAAGRDRPRDPGHLRRHPRRLDPPGLALRRRHRRRRPRRRWGMRLRMKAGYDISGHHRPGPR